MGSSILWPRILGHFSGVKMINFKTAKVLFYDQLVFADESKQLSVFVGTSVDVIKGEIHFVSRLNTTDEEVTVLHSIGTSKKDFLKKVKKLTSVIEQFANVLEHGPVTFHSRKWLNKQFVDSTASVTVFSNTSSQYIEIADCSFKFKYHKRSYQSLDDYRDDLIKIVDVLKNFKKKFIEHANTK